MISSAVLRQTKGLGSSFQCSAHNSIASLSASTLENTPWRRRRSVRSLNQPSTRLSQELEVGVAKKSNIPIFVPVVGQDHEGAESAQRRRELLFAEFNPDVLND